MAEPESDVGEPRRARPPTSPDEDVEDVEERYRSLFDQNPQAVFRLGVDGRFTELNPSAGEVSGYRAGELVGRHFHELVVHEDHDRASEAFARVIEHGSQQVDLAIRRADGQVVDLFVTGIPWKVDGATRGVYVVADDVTGRNHAARELDATRRFATEAARAKTDFVARMSHEVRTPLTSILAAVELLADTGPSPEQTELITTLQRSGTRLLALVDGVLDFSAADSASAPTTEEFDVHALIGDAVALVEKSARRKGLRLDLDLGADVPRRVRDHPTWTSQILVNLLSNAVEHTETGGVELAVSTTVTARSGPAILYRVADTGIGIDPSRHEQIFEPFSRLPTPGSTGTPRAGLGLSIVKQLVAVSGGTIAVDSALGRGSTFFVLLPVEPLDDHDVP
ncbi:ATP-binding protein [Nocardioides sp. 1609]|uniref:PAS domain-containing sensor histidine kinase n=1 Tax=Nocardioides sp. 1609 TaxID=2508327 RepID=UPI00106FF7E8|nr:ATP-binding protein [Nocardioides sp. 1609]